VIEDIKVLLSEFDWRTIANPADPESFTDTLLLLLVLAAVLVVAQKALARLFR
jgi:hypothetical protein